MQDDGVSFLSPVGPLEVESWEAEERGGQSRGSQPVRCSRTGALARAPQVGSGAQVSRFTPGCLLREALWVP